MEQAENKRVVFRERVDAEGGVVIPAAIRERHQIKPGQELILEDLGDCIRIRTMGEFIREFQEHCQKQGDPNECWSEELISERREEAKRE